MDNIPTYFIFKMSCNKIFLNISPFSLPKSPLKNIACVWQGRDCRLILHYDLGLTLLSNAPTASTTLPTGSTSGALTNGPAQPHVFWRCAFENIKSTGDDAARFFWIDFGSDSGEQVSVLYSINLTIILSYFCRFFFIFVPIIYYYDEANFCF